jgi:hypothetical protein
MFGSLKPHCWNEQLWLIESLFFFLAGEAVKRMIQVTKSPNKKHYKKQGTGQNPPKKMWKLCSPFKKRRKVSGCYRFQSSYCRLVFSSSVACFSQACHFTTQLGLKSQKWYRNCVGYSYIIYISFIYHLYIMYISFIYHLYHHISKSNWSLTHHSTLL